MEGSLSIYLTTCAASRIVQCHNSAVSDIIPASLHTQVIASCCLLLAHRASPLDFCPLVFHSIFIHRLRQGSQIIKNNSNANIPVPTRNDSTQKTLSDEKEIDKMIEIVTVYKHIDLWQVCPGTMNRLVCPLRFDKACPGERIALERAAIHKFAASAKVSAVEKVWLGTIKFLCADLWPALTDHLNFKTDSFNRLHPAP